MESIDAISDNRAWPVRRGTGSFTSEHRRGTAQRTEVLPGLSRPKD